MTSRFTVSKTEKNLLADDASAERGYGSTGRGSTSGYEDADFHASFIYEEHFCCHQPVLLAAFSTLSVYDACMDLQRLLIHRSYPLKPVLS